MAEIFQALSFEPWTFLFQAINVAIVLGLLYLILWKPLSQSFANREEKIEGDLRKANSAKRRSRSDII